MKDKTIFLLIGPKGSGKSFIGNILHERFKIKFVHVESWILKLKKNRDVFDQQYIEDVFRTIEIGVIKELNTEDSIAFESTGLSESFDRMISNLKSRFQVVTIGVQADSDLCLQRVKSRDQSIHIKVTDEQVIDINQQVIENNLVCDYYIDNNNQSQEMLIDQIQKLLYSV